MVRSPALLLALLFAAACDDDRPEDAERVEQCQSYCTVGAGFPCACSDIDPCKDGSTCGMLEPGDALGICMRPCESDSDCTTNLPCAARPRCSMEHEETGEMHCGYFCDYSEQCPRNMFCRDVGGDGEGVCSPRL